MSLCVFVLSAGRNSRLRGRFRFDAKARINNKDYTVISAPRIDRSLMPSPLSVGNCISATLILSILTDDTITAKSPVVIMGRLTNDKTATEWKEFGTFYIDQRDTSFAGLVTIDCYDAMLKTNQNYLDGSDTAANWPKSMKSVVEEIAYRIGVGIDLRTRIKTGADYVVPYPSGKTMSQVLGYIGACHGGNWIITEENLLRLVPLTTGPRRDVPRHRRGLQQDHACQRRGQSASASGLQGADHLQRRAPCPIWCAARQQR